MTNDRSAGSAAWGAGRYARGVAISDGCIQRVCGAHHPARALEPSSGRATRRELHLPLRVSRRARDRCGLAYSDSRSRSLRRSPAFGAGPLGPRLASGAVSAVRARLYDPTTIPSLSQSTAARRHVVTRCCRASGLQAFMKSPCPVRPGCDVGAAHRVVGRHGVDAARRQDPLDVEHELRDEHRVVGRTARAPGVGHVGLVVGAVEVHAVPALRESQLEGEAARRHRPGSSPRSSGCWSSPSARCSRAAVRSRRRCRPRRSARWGRAAPWPGPAG